MEHQAGMVDGAIGPADRPDDPLVNPVRTPPPVLRASAQTTRPEATTPPPTPTPDQEGCYYLG